MTNILHVYKLYHPDDPNIFYVGSTLNSMLKRFHNHSSDYNRRNRTSKLHNYIKTKNGFDGFLYEILEVLPILIDGDKFNQRLREQLWMDKLKPTLNQQRAFTTEEQRREVNERARKSTKGKEYRTNWNDKKRHRNKLKYILCEIIGIFKFNKWQKWLLPEIKNIFD